ncbi:MAG: CopG family transcriptional regulator [Acidobacteriaceae bacterium]
MRRTQLYLDEGLWNVLHQQARTQKTTISELVRRAARERYMKDVEERRSAMRALVGLRADRDDIQDTEKYLRELRKSGRIERLHKQ